MSNINDEKYNKLCDYLKSLKKVAVAYSSGVDSTFLLKVAFDTLGADNVIAVTASSSWFPDREYEEAKNFCTENGIKQIIVNIDENDVEGFKENPVNRCYICKKAIFSRLLEIAKENGIDEVVEGSNLDDNGDYRPGHIAIKELNIKSPLREASLTKAEIRELSKELNLKTWKKPSFACLASRFVYGETINKEKLSLVDKAEQLLMDMGFEQFRVRIHGDKDFIARIEVNPSDITKIAEDNNREKIFEAFKSFGFSYVALDLKGYRTGSMNETILK